VIGAHSSGVPLHRNVDQCHGKSDRDPPIDRLESLDTNMAIVT
jgi:hypothetical protein